MEARPLPPLVPVVNARAESDVRAEGAPTRIHCGFVVPDPHASADFFERLFGFRRTVDLPEYVHLRRDDPAAEIGFALAGALAAPSAFRPPFDGNGVWVTIEVPAIEPLFADFAASDYPLVEPLVDRSFGERHFVVRAPGGILVNVVARGRSQEVEGNA